MLCTRMRLFERRYIPMPRESFYTEGVPPTSQPSIGYTQRPCIVRNLEGNNQNGILNNTPRAKRTEKKNKIPLVVFSLKMQPGTKTLAQQDVKRDPRRLPFFCSQYKHTKREQKEYQQQQQQQQNQQQANSTELLNSNRTSLINENDENLSKTLFVQGVEILTDTQTKEDENKEYEKNNIKINDNIYYDNFVPKELQHIQLTDCCQCMRDVNLLKKELQFGYQQQQQIIKEHQIDGRYLSINNGGVVEGSYRKLRTQPFVCSRVLKRVPSPTTRQVINVTMNTKK